MLFLNIDFYVVVYLGIKPATIKVATYREQKKFYSKTRGYYQIFYFLFWAQKSEMYSSKEIERSRLSADVLLYFILNVQFFL